MSEFVSAPALILLPAVDVSDGKAVRLTQGEAGSETNYGDPVDAAVDWTSQGAEWIHLVDLDAAFGRGNNHAVIRQVIRQVGGNVQIDWADEVLAGTALTHAGELRHGPVGRALNLSAPTLQEP